MMLILDTNVISEPLAKTPDPRVIRWLKEHNESLYLCSVSIGGLYVGARLLPRGKRREGILAAVDDIAVRFQDFILPYDFVAARRYAVLQETARQTGRRLTVEDGMILAICRENDATLATRNTKDFCYLTDRLINPWNED
jgi:predicted nucleic acid-binding protein